MKRLLLLVVLPLILLPITTANAADFTVDATTAYIAADGLCSLVEAIENANADAAIHADCPAGAGADVITLTRNVILDGSAVFAVPGNGDAGLPSLTSDITIEGAGFTISRQTGAPDFRILHVGPGATVTLNRVTITGGQFLAGFVDGAGILNNGTLTVSESTITNNLVGGIFPSGGGIYNDGTLSVINTTISNNRADETLFPSVFGNGGGIYNLGVLNLQNATLQNNVATDSGGGVYNTGTATIDNSVFAGNSATDGGALFNTGVATTSLDITNSTFTNNVATEFGGAILNGSMNLTIFGSTFTGNQSTIAGSALHNIGGTSDIVASIFDGNIAQANGAISNVSLGTINITGSIIRNNTSAGNAGGVFTQLALINIMDSLISGNFAETGGGGIFEGSSNFGGYVVERTTFINNRTNFIGGGALFTSTFTNSQIINSTFTGNQAATFGAGIGLNAGGVVEVYYTTIAENSSTAFINTVGGGNFFAGTATLNGVILANNLSVDCSATSSSLSLGYNITPGPFAPPSFMFPTGRWCSFIARDPTDLPATDPLLGPLSSTGNVGASYGLLPGSPAIDIVPMACPGILNGVDQRGVPRLGATCDAGSVSGDPVVLPIVYFSTPSVTIEEDGTAMGELVIDNTAGTFSAPTTVDLTVYISQSGSAAPTVDFTGTQPTALTLTFDAATFPAPGTSITVPFDFTALDDLLPEGNETIQLTAFIAGPGVLDPARSTFGVTILDDDLPPVIPSEVAQATPQLDIFDPAISKIGFLLPGQLGITGEVLEWMITVRNPGNVTGNNVVVTDTLRSELRVDRVTTSRGTSNTNGQTVTVDVGSLAPGESVQISIFTTVLSGNVPPDNLACVNASNQAQERCARGLAVGSLPNTGENPWWRTPLLALLALAGLGLVIRAIPWRFRAV